MLPLINASQVLPAVDICEQNDLLEQERRGNIMPEPRNTVKGCVRRSLLVRANHIGIFEWIEIVTELCSLTHFEHRVWHPPLTCYHFENFYQGFRWQIVYTCSPCGTFDLVNHLTRGIAE